MTIKPIRKKVNVFLNLAVSSVAFFDIAFPTEINATAMNIMTKCSTVKKRISLIFMVSGPNWTLGLIKYKANPKRNWILN